MNRSFCSRLILSLLFCLPQYAPGQSHLPAAPPALLPAALFTGQAPLAMTIQADMRGLLKDRGDERDEHPAHLAYRDAGGAVDMQEIKIRVRGNFRRQARNCSFPPLRLNVKKKRVKGTLFEGQDKLKLVVPCRQGNPAYEQYLLLEYLVYRMYNELTDFSFRVRLVEVAFEDTEGRWGRYETYGFLIEDEEAMAERNRGALLDQERHHPEAMDRTQVTLLALFQYMIGNTDWSVPALHNIKLVHQPDQLYPHPVPYDFDFCGFINTPYALPPAGLPIKKVTDRHYQGYCRSNEELAPLVALFQEKRAVFVDLLEREVPLRSRYRKEALAFLDDFYGVIDDLDRAQRVFGQQCRRLD